jgi:hypothetical protein
MIRCASCGSESAPGSRFCAFCGARLTPEDETSRPHDRDPGIGQPAARQPSSVDRGPSIDRRSGAGIVSVRLEPNRIPAQPGTDAVVEVKVRNNGRIVDGFRVTVEGPAAAWTDIVPSTIRLMPGTEGTVVLRLHPPRDATVAAGSIGFGVRVASGADVGDVTTESGVIELGPVRRIAASVAPATGRAARVAWYELSVENLGNVAVRVNLAGKDVDDEAHVRIDPASLELGRGERGLATVRATAKRVIWVGRPERRDLLLTVDDGGDQRQTIRATFIQQGLIAGWFVKLAGTAAAAAFALALLGIALAPPTLNVADVGERSGSVPPSSHRAETPPDQASPGPDGRRGGETGSQGPAGPESTPTTPADEQPTVALPTLPTGRPPGGGGQGPGPQGGTAPPTQGATLRPTTAPTKAPAPADLVVASVGVAPASPVRDKPATVTVWVRNIGAGPAAAFNVVWDPGGGPALSERVPGLAAGAGAQLEFTYSFPSASTVDAVAIADADGDVKEQSESNNRRLHAIAVKLPPPETVCVENVLVRESDWDVPTGCSVLVGDRISITASGVIRSGNLFEGDVGPGGLPPPHTSPSTFPKPSAQPFSLLGRIGSYFSVGRGISDFKVGANGALLLRINDDVPGNGSGSFTAHVEVVRQP